MHTFGRLETLISGPLCLAATLLVAALVTACAGAGATPGLEGQKPETQPDPQAAATRALDPLRKLVTAQTYRDLGFDDPSEAASATLGEPIRVSMVRLDALRQYEAGRDPERLLTDAGRVIYPIEVKNQVKSSIIVEGVAGQWKATSFGGPHLVRQIARFRSDVNARIKPAQDSMSVVHVAALNLYFLGYRVDGRLMLTPLESQTNYKLEAGAVLRADQVFATLAPFARSYNGLPQ
jgi:hypothetical protein